MESADRKSLFIDNFDSFTYNLVDDFAKRQCQTRVYRADTSLSDLKAVVDEFDPDLLVISPGPGNPDTAGVSLAGGGRLQEQAAHLRRVPGPSGDRAVLRRSRQPRPGADARQALADHPQRQGTLPGHREPAAGRTISQPRGPHAARLPGESPASSRASSWEFSTRNCPSSACSSIPRAS